jgi:Zn-dependent M28 family amino/carboxypeptidase
VLELARVIHETGATFRHTLKLCLFTGEEQGLVGSRALASQYAEEGVDVVAMFNADMIGYAPEGDDIVLAYMNRFSDPDLTELSRDITELYVPEVQTDLTNVCCSDQQSFYENGFSSVGFFETPNPSVSQSQVSKQLIRWHRLCRKMAWCVFWARGGGGRVAAAWTDTLTLPSRLSTPSTTRATTCCSSCRRRRSTCCPRPPLLLRSCSRSRWTCARRRATQPHTS